MFTPLAKLAIGLSATMATAFYYLAAAPLASAQYVCGPGNFSSACGGKAPSPAPIADPVEEVPVIESPAPIAEPVEEVPVVESPAPIADPVQEVPVESPAPIADPVEEVSVIEVPAPPAPVPSPRPVPSMEGWPQHWIDRYNEAIGVKPTVIPEPGTVVALLVTGAGMICCGRRRNKQVRQQR